MYSTHICIWNLSHSVLYTHFTFLMHPSPRGAAGPGEKTEKEEATGLVTGL